MKENCQVLEDDRSSTINNPQIQTFKDRRQGGYKSTIFIFIMIGLENIGFVANMVSLVLYFMAVMKFDISGAATAVANYLGTAFMLTLLSGFISDSYVNRLNTTLVCGVIELLGYVLLIIQAWERKLQPEACGKTSCVKGSQALMFYLSIYLMALGQGGIRGALPALGADQFNQKNSRERKKVASFFNWFLLSITIGACIGVTFVVWVSQNVDWYLGFLISVITAAVGLIVLSLGKPYFRTRVPGESPLQRMLQVFVVAFRNRKLELPANSEELYEMDDEEYIQNVESIPHTNQLRLLDKAAILPKGFKAEPWRVCTVTQVEEAKIITQMMPILLSTILMNTCLAQLQTVSVQQGTFMDTHIGSFNVPSASIPIIPLVFMSLLIPIYEFLFVPLVRSFTGHPNGITHLQRVGVGLVLSSLSMAVAGLVEIKRKHAFNRHGEKISVFWLGIHYAIFGVADMFTLVGLMEFFYREAPAGMRSLATSFAWLTLSLGFFLSSAFVNVTNVVTRKLSKSERGWIEGNNMNINHVELFYWFLAVLSVLNFINYLFWSSWYEYKQSTTGSEMEEVQNTKVGPTDQDGKVTIGQDYDHDHDHHAMTENRSSETSPHG